MTRTEKEKSSRFCKQSKTKRKLGFGNWNVWITDKFGKPGQLDPVMICPSGQLGRAKFGPFFFC